MKWKSTYLQPPVQSHARASQRGSGTRRCAGHAGKAGALRGSNEAGKGGTAIGLDRTRLARQLPSGPGQQPGPEPLLLLSASLPAEVSVPAGGDQARPSPPAAALISSHPPQRRRLSALRVTGRGPSSPAETMGSREAGSALRLDGEEDFWAFFKKKNRGSQWQGLS